MPALDVFGQPFLFNFEALVRAATDPDGQVRKLLDKAVLDATGVRVLWWQSYGSTVFVSKGRDARTPASIQRPEGAGLGRQRGEFTDFAEAFLW